MSKERLEEFREFIDFMYESIDIEDHQRFIAISESMIKDGWFKWIYRFSKEQAEQVDSMAHVIKVKGKEMRELSDFLKNRNIPLKELSPLITVMNHVQELEEELEKSRTGLFSCNMCYERSEQQNKRYREALEKLVNAPQDMSRGRYADYAYRIAREELEESE